MAKTRISLGYCLKEEGIGNILKFIEKFNQSHPKVEVVPQMIADTEDKMVEKIVTSPIDAASPDIIIIYSEKLALLAEKEKIVALNDWLLLSSNINLEDFPAKIWECVTYRNKIWGMPIIEANPFCLLYNHQLFQEYKIENPPHTWDELLEFASILTKDRDKDGLIDQWGYTFQPHHFFIFLWQQGGDVLERKTDNIIFNGPEGVKTLNFILELTNFCAPSSGSIQEKAAMQIYRLTNDLPDLNKYKVAHLPKGKKRFNTFGCLKGPWCIAIIKKKKCDVAWEFIHWWEDDPNLLSWCLMTNYLPLKKTIIYQEEYQKKLKKYRFLEILIDELEFAQPIPCHPFYPKIRKFLEEGLSIVNTKDILDKTTAQKFLNLIAKNALENLILK